MNCEEFLKLVPDFIEDSLEEHHYDGFIRHAKECSDCKDELEVHYMIRVGLERIDEDSTKSFDIRSELQNQLLQYENRADSIFRHNVYRKVTFVIAEICALILAVIQILRMI
ncbi:MAG: zf-HC2 domain-containing protein [Lachnospiraceae bacterium]|nr:zf-HC2 domain-containing protein [Lachnospiraceae bacterium]